MTVNWDKANEFEHGLIIDGLVHIGNDDGETHIKDSYVPKLYAKELPFKFFHIPVDREVIIPEGHQLNNYNGFEIRGQLTIRGMLVLK